MDNFSVIIRAKNEEAWIGHCIQSVIDYFNNPEIIIIDNGSTDETIQIANNFKKNKKISNKKKLKEKTNYTEIKLLRINEYSPGKSLNYGVKNCTHKKILIISAHCIIKKLNLNSISENLKNYCSIFANQIPIWKGKRIIKKYIWSHFIDKKQVNMFSELENRYFFHNAAAIYNKSILKKFPFDENLSSKEDRYWANEIVKKNKKYLYDPNFVVEHHYTPGGSTWDSK